MFRIAIATTLLIAFLSLNTVAQYNISNRCLQAWEMILNLNLDSADSLNSCELKNNPNNYYCVYLSQTIDSYRLMTNMSEEGYESLCDKYEIRMKFLRDKDTESPHYLRCKAEMQLQMALFNIMFGDRFSGLHKAYVSYRNSRENIEMYPEFIQNQKLSGLFNVAISNLPPTISWAAGAFGVIGNDTTGYRILESYYNSMKTVQGLGAEAALFNILAFKLNKDPETAYTFIQSLDTSNLDFSLIRYFSANIAYRTGRNEEALKIINDCDNKNEVSFNGYNYIMGKILFRKLDTSASYYFKKHIAYRSEYQYHKAINYRLAILSLIAGDTLNFLYYKNDACHTGNDMTERDREAMYDCSLDYIPNIDLVCARLSINGGYLDTAFVFLESYKNSKLTKDTECPYNTEYVFLKGKYYLKSGNLSAASTMLLKVLDQSKELDYHFAAESAMLLGKIYEEINPLTAIEYYKAARDLYQSDFYEYIDEISKKRIVYLRSKIESPN